MRSTLELFKDLLDFFELKCWQYKASKKSVALEKKLRRRVCWKIRCKGKSKTRNQENLADLKGFMEICEENRNQKVEGPITATSQGMGLLGVEEVTFPKTYWWIFFFFFLECKLVKSWYTMSLIINFFMRMILFWFSQKQQPAKRFQVFVAWSSHLTIPLTWPLIPRSRYPMFSFIQWRTCMKASLGYVGFLFKSIPLITAYKHWQC